MIYLKICKNRTRIIYKDSETAKNIDKTINQTDFEIDVTPEVEIKEDVSKFQSGEKNYCLGLK